MKRHVFWIRRALYLITRASLPKTQERVLCRKKPPFSWKQPRIGLIETQFHKKAPIFILQKKAPIFMENAPYMIDRDTFSITNILYWIIRVLHSIKRALRLIKRALYSTTGNLYSIIRALYSILRASLPETHDIYIYIYIYIKKKGCIAEIPVIC